MIETITAAKSFSLSKFSAKIDVIAEAGIADIIMTVFIAFDGVTTNDEIK
ncbi:hypothetical protein GCM10022410_06500 [Amphibacillus indicireducens]|uniref:Uncharacterized protein n=1 Tax=Amphibacillus indicireducens TaxID=1076330 RepID=A0ABP7V9F4_9BACI